jgi:hypothetical protein
LLNSGTARLTSAFSGEKCENIGIGSVERVARISANEETEKTKLIEGGGQINSLEKRTDQIGPISPEINQSID